MPPKNARKPSVSDAAVRAKTGKDWAGWFGMLDRAKASKLTHKEIAKLLMSKHAVPGWWSQMITVEYEIARGLRALYEHSDGFSFTISKLCRSVSMRSMLPRQTRVSASAGSPRARSPPRRRPRTNI